MHLTLNYLALICLALLNISISTRVHSPNTECPTITIDCPTSCYKPGQPFTVIASVTGADPKKSLSYNWSVSSGTINGGQGTPSITLTQSTDCQVITATVEVIGLDSSCHNTASCTTTTDCCWAISRRFDKYGDLAFADEKKRLDNFAEQLKNEPGSQAYIIVYGKQGAPNGEAQVRADRARQYLIDMLGIGRERIVTVDGGIHVRFTLELWITPQGGVPPQPEDQQQ